MNDQKYFFLWTLFWISKLFTHVCFGEVGQTELPINRLYLYATKTQWNSKSPIFLRLAPLNTFGQRVNLPKYFWSAHSAHGWNWYPHFQTYLAKWTYPVAYRIFLRFLICEYFVTVKKISKFQVVHAHSAPFMTKIRPKNNFFQKFFCFSQFTYFRLYARQISSKSDNF